MGIKIPKSPPPPTNSYYVFQGYQLVTMDWFMVALCLGFIGVRFYVRIYLRSGGFCKVHWSDAFIIISWLLFLVYSIIDTIRWRWGAFGPYDTLEGKANFTNNWIRSQQINVIQYALRIVCIYTVKFAMCCFYNEVVSRMHRKLWLSIRYIAGFTAICLLATELVNFLYTASFRSSVIIESLHVFTDIGVYGLLPILIVRKMQSLSGSQKGGILVMFMIQFLSTACSVVVLILGAWKTKDWYLNNARRLCINIEQPTAILVTCCPSFRYLIRHRIWRRQSATIATKEVAAAVDESQGSGSGKDLQNLKVEHTAECSS